MTTTITDQKVIDLINRAFDTDGLLVAPKSRKNQKEARQILESGVNYYGELLNGFDVYYSLLIIAYPNKEI